MYRPKSLQWLVRHYMMWSRDFFAIISYCSLSCSPVRVESTFFCALNMPGKLTPWHCDICCSLYQNTFFSLTWHSPLPCFGAFAQMSLSQWDFLRLFKSTKSPTTFPDLFSIVFTWAIDTLYILVIILFPPLHQKIRSTRAETSVLFTAVSHT